MIEVTYEKSHCHLEFKNDSVIESFIFHLLSLFLQAIDSSSKSSITYFREGMLDRHLVHHFIKAINDHFGTNVIQEVDY